MADRIVDTKINKFLGIALPITNGQYGYFTPTVLTLDQVKTNLKNLLLTRRGERLMRPNLGIDLYTLIFEKIDEVVMRDTITTYITEAVNRWLPYVVVDNINVYFDATNKSQIFVNIRFTIDQEIYEELTFSIIKS